MPWTAQDFLYSMICGDLGFSGLGGAKYPAKNGFHIFKSLHWIQNYRQYC